MPKAIENATKPEAEQTEGEGTKKAETPSQSGGLDLTSLDGKDTFTRAEAEAIARKLAGEMTEASIQTRLKRAEEVHAAKAEEAARVEREADLVRKQEFEKLSKEQGARIATLEAEAADRTAALDAAKATGDMLTTTIAEALDAEIKEAGLPESVGELLAGMTVLDRRSWWTKHRAEYSKVRPTGVAPTPRPGQNRGAASEEAASEEQRRLVQQMA